MVQRRTWIVVGAVVAVALVAGGLFWFQPWKLWVDTRVDEALPVTAVAADQTQTVSAPPVSVPALPPPTTSPSPTTSPPGVGSPTTSSPPPAGTPVAPSAPVASSAPVISSVPAAPVVLRTGTLISHEHETSGTAAVVQLPDGSRVLTLENLSTSDGPDVRVWLSSAPVIPGEEGWYTFADAPHVDLGALKGNLGNQVYEIPADVDLAALPNISLWCQRFSVSFGAAELLP